MIPRDPIAIAILREVYGNPEARSGPAGDPAEPPENLTRFFRARRGKMGCNSPKNREERKKKLWPGFPGDSCCSPPGPFRA